MESHIVINFVKTARSLKDFQEAFSEQHVIMVEVVKATSSNLDLTDKVQIFINSWSWKNSREFVLIFTAMFKVDGMIPGLYKIELDKKTIAKELQAWAYKVDPK